MARRYTYPLLVKCSVLFYTLMRVPTMRGWAIIKYIKQLFIHEFFLLIFLQQYKKWQYGNVTLEGKSSRNKKRAYLSARENLRQVFDHYHEELIKNKCIEQHVH